MRTLMLALVVFMSIAPALAPSAPAGMATLRVGAPPTGKASGRPSARQPRPPVAYVARVEGAVAIDGRLDEKAWKRATRLSLDRTLDGTGPARQATTVLLLRDTGRLFLGIRCAESRMDRIRPGRTGRDVTVWTADSIEVFIGPAGGAYHRFGVNAAGGATDGRAKDDSWNAPFRVATSRAKDAWTVEMVLPLASMAGKKLPTEWAANFNRTRHAAGAGQEFAWSPTFSGDSHVPARFGKLLLTDPPADRPAAGAGPVEIVPVPTGVAVVRLDLSDLPKGATVHRADLRLFRRVGAGGATEDALARVEVYPLADGFKRPAAPRPAGRPLALRGPWFDRLDATQAVRAWAGRKGRTARMDFFVRSAPPLQLDATCLDLVYEGEGRKPPAQVEGLKALHRAGQTFLTWKDREDAFGAGPVTWGQIRAHLDKTDPRQQVRYRVYRHARPIDARSVRDAVLLAEVSSLSGFNVNSWSLERLINQAVFGNEDRGELGKYGPFGGWSRHSPEGGKLIIPRLAIEDGRALPAGTGLYVHSCPAGAPGQKAYYAVTVATGGVENLSAFSPANSLARPVTEGPAAWEPVEQPAGGGFGFDFRGRRHFYVTWLAPPLAPRPMYSNWSVLVPPECKEPRPVELYFHAPGYSYARPPVKFLDRSIQVCPHDYPFSGWYGYNDAAGTLKSPAKGVVRPYTIRRIERFLKWARGRFPIDPERIIAVGGDGAGLMALYRPKLLAYVISPGFEGRQLNPRAAGPFIQAWGPRSRQARNADGLSEWAWGELDYVLAGARLPNRRDRKKPPPEILAGAPGFEKDLPLFICGGRSWGVDPGYARGLGRLYYAIQGTRNPLYGKWGWQQPEYPDKYTGRWRGLDLTRSAALPAISRNSGDVDSEAAGNANGEIIWKDVKDTVEAFEVTILGPDCTFDLTPRRLSRFKLAPGTKVNWEAISEPTSDRAKKPDPMSGKAVADKHGLVTLQGLKLGRDCVLKVRITKAG